MASYAYLFKYIIIGDTGSRSFEIFLREKKKRKERKEKKEIGIEK